MLLERLVRNGTCENRELAKIHFLRVHTPYCRKRYLFASYNILLYLRVGDNPDI